MTESYFLFIYTALMSLSVGFLFLILIYMFAGLVSWLIMAGLIITLILFGLILILNIYRTGPLNNAINPL